MNDFNCSSSTTRATSQILHICGSHTLTIGKCDNSLHFKVCAKLLLLCDPEIFGALSAKGRTSDLGHNVGIAALDNQPDSDQPPDQLPLLCSITGRRNIVAPSRSSPAQQNLAAHNGASCRALGAASAAAQDQGRSQSSNPH